MRYRSVFAFSLATFLSRIFGFVREGVIAYLLGASGIADAFYTALRIPALLRDLLAENAIQNAFIPSYIEAEVTDNRPNEFLGTVTILWLSVAFAFSLLGIIFAPTIVSLIAYGFRSNPSKFLLAVKLVRITSFYLFLVSASAIASGLLNVARSFFLPAVSPVLFNIGIIASGLVSMKFFNLPKIHATAMAVGVILGGVLQTAFLTAVLVKKRRFRIKVALDLRHPQLKKLKKLFVPVALSTGFSRITLFVNTLIASFLRDGAIAYLNYAFRVMHLPLGLFGVAVSTVALPDIAESVARKENPSKVVANGLALSLFLTLGTSVFIILEADSILSFLFERGSFGRYDTMMAASALVFYSMSIVPASLSKVMLSVYFSRGQTKVPNLGFAISAFANIFTAIVLAPKLDFPSLAIATAVGSWVQLGFLWYHLKDIDLAAAYKVIFKIVFVALASALLISRLKIEVFSLKFQWIPSFVIFGAIYIAMSMALIDEIRSFWIKKVLKIGRKGG